MGALILFQFSIELAGGVLYSMTFINNNVVPRYFGELWPVMLAHQEFIGCYQDIELLWQNLLSEANNKGDQN